jgi:hypothetical protein
MNLHDDYAAALTTLLHALRAMVALETKVDCAIASHDLEEALYMLKNHLGYIYEDSLEQFDQNFEDAGFPGTGLRWWQEPGMDTEDVFVMDLITDQPKEF